MSIIAIQLKKIVKMFEQILVKLPNIKLKENPFSVLKLLHKNKTERHALLIGAFLQLSLWPHEKER
jgi:hypothetical protein